MRIYRRMTELGECIITARIRQLGTGGIAFETSLFGEKPYELNMNMPTFSTAREADAWIMRAGDWRRADETVSETESVGQGPEPGGEGRQ